MELKYPKYHLLLVLIFVSLSSATTGNPLISYAELQQLNVSCPFYDTCSNENGSITDSLSSRPCECGEHCKKYRTCCVDSPHRDLQGADSSRKSVGCHNLQGSFYPYFMVTTCDPKWSGNVKIKSLCVNESPSLRDPVILTPATNRRSGMVYKNYFCAMCNDDLKELTMWNIKVSELAKNGFGIDRPNKTLEDMIYNETSNQWGFYSGPRNESFDPLIITFEDPRGLERMTKICIPNIMSVCDVKWTDETVRKKCHAYMAAVYAWTNEESSGGRSSKYYRNIHCAICNYAVAKGPSCWRGFISGYAGQQPMSFTSLIDVNPQDGKFVGRVSRCKEGESYDEFFKKCRTLVCALPGHTIVNGNCTKS